MVQQKSATDVLQQSTCAITRMDPSKLPGKREKTIQCVALPLQKNRLQTATLLASPTKSVFSSGRMAAEHFVRKSISGYTYNL